MGVGGVLLIEEDTLKGPVLHMSCVSPRGPLLPDILYKIVDGAFVMLGHIRVLGTDMTENEEEGKKEIDD